VQSFDGSADFRAAGAKTAPSAYCRRGRPNQEPPIKRRPSPSSTAPRRTIPRPPGPPEGALRPRPAATAAVVHISDDLTVNPVSPGQSRSESFVLC
jgi:hypothetical protein